MTFEEEAYIARLEAKVRRYEAALRSIADHSAILLPHVGMRSLNDIANAALADDAQPPAVTA